MNDLIDRQDAIDALSTPHGILYPIRTIEELPSAQQDCTDCTDYDTERHSCPRYCDVIRQTLAEAKQERTGRWIYGEDKYGIDGYHCDKCGFFVPWDYAHKFINYIEDYNFCPNCGADMSEGE